MLKFILCGIVMGWSLHVSANDEEKKPKKNIREKALFYNKAAYDKALKKSYQKNKDKPPMKIYKRQDGSIDTFKTINEGKNR